jgi:uncharacterized protein with von Willebrand factor type A (vWA) domain
MTSERIKEIQQQTAYPNSVSVQQALLQVWNECLQLPQQEISDEEIEKGAAHHEPMVTRRTWISACKWYREQIKLK